MRNKVFLIRGWANLAAQITAAEFERINAEHVFLICALRRPQFLPPEADADPSTLMHQYKMVMDHWKVIEQDHLLVAEYGHTVIDHGRGDVKAVEGDPLLVPWFYETVKAIHKSFGQTVIEVNVLYGQHWPPIQIDQDRMTVDEAVARLSGNQIIG